MKLIGLLCLVTLLSCNNKTSTLEQKKAATEKLFIKTDSSNMKGDFASSHRVLDSVFQRISKPTTWEKILYYSATCWMNRSLGRYDLCIKKGDSCLTVLNTLPLGAETVETYSNIYLEKGMAYVGMNNYNEANKCFFEAKKAINQVNDSCSKQGLLSYLGLVLYQQHEYELAKNAFIEELDCLNKCYKNNLYLQYGARQQAIGNIGLSYFNLHNNDSAKWYFLQELLLCDEERKYLKAVDTSKIDYGYNAKIGVVLGNLAKVYIPSNLDSAALLLEQAVQLNKAHTRELADGQLCMYQLADVYLLQKKYNQANEMLQGLKLSLDTAKNTGATLGYKKSLYNYYLQTKQHENALIAYQNYLTLKDSLQNKQQGFTTTNVNKELKDRQQQLEIQLLQKDKNLSNLYLWIIAAALAVSAIIAIIIYKNFKQGKKKNGQLIKLNNEIIEQQKLTEEALRQLSVSNKEKDRILNVVAHDLRNPIGAIANFLDIVQLKYEHSEDEEKILKSSQTAAVHSLTLINELLEVNELNNGKLTLSKTQIDLLEIVNTVVEQLNFKANSKQQKLNIITHSNNIHLNADAEKLQRVITNLIDNAIKFSAINKTIDILIQQNNSYVLLQVKDAGIGIPASIKEQLFTASITVKRSGTNNEKSNGLGLSICKQIIEAHNGTIWVESEEENGSSFFIQLPTQDSLVNNI